MTRENGLANTSGEAGPGEQQQWSVYEIKIAGPLEAHWQQWFEGMTLEIKENGEGGATCTVITGPVRDQPALHGLFAIVRDFNLTLISVRKVVPDTQSNQEDGQNDQR